MGSKLKCGLHALLALPAFGAPVIVQAAEAGKETVEVIGEKFNKARNGLSPKTGSSRFVFDERDIAQLPRGEETPVNHLMLQAPGVVQGDNVGLYIRGEMTQPQYRINGILIPEGIGGFGHVFDLRMARRVELLTGALPAQYNYRTSVIDIETKQRFDNGGKVSLGGGSYGTINPALEVAGATEQFTYYVTGSHLRARNGILFPTSDDRTIHNDTRQGKGFAMVSFTPDARSRWSLMAGAAESRFQIPNVRGESPTFPLDGIDDFPPIASADLNETQREMTRYAVVSYEGNNGSNLDYQVALFTRDSEVLFRPDTIGDLIYRGIASRVASRSRADGLQVDASYEDSKTHTIRAGFSFSHQRTDSDNKSLVFSADSDGAQLPGAPISVNDGRSVAADLAGLYVQDEWRPSKALTVNYGLRFDYLDGLTKEHQFSPRVNAVYKLNDRTSLHAGYSRFFNPPRLELIGPDTISKFQNTTNQPEVAESSPVVAERTHYVEVGVSHQLTPALNLGVSAYAKRIRDMVDFGQFGQALVYSPYNWSRSKIYGIEFTGQYRSDDFSAYWNAAVSSAKGKGISSGQYNFEREEMDYINGNWVYMDHDQRLAVSAGVAYRWSGTVFSADAFFGSGMRRTPEGGTPNSDHLPSYVQANVGVAREMSTASGGKIALRLAVINLFDRSYEVRDGTGVGVGAPQFGPRRSIYGSLSLAF